MNRHKAHLAAGSDLTIQDLQASGHYGWWEANTDGGM